ncbi:MAG: F-type H+-transporting ATPase subunit epsilon [Streptosporangiaceae bacterium]|nr:F-type H+-transporting ATPase subunit epsilon [Streptosporangiaceae bacterium]
MPDGEIWSGNARMVIAKTLDGDIGVMGGHPPVLGILAEGSVVRILDPEVGDESQGEEVMIAVSSGFLAIADDRVSILSRQAEVGGQVDRAAAQAQLDAALEAAGSLAPGDQEPTEVKYSRALLRAAGERF